MKRVLLIFILFAALLQVKAQKTYDLYIEGGANVCKITGMKAGNFKSVPGYHFGIGYDYLFSDPVGVNLGFFFNNRGYSSESTD